MAFQTVFKRYELKYLLTYEQKEKVFAAMSSYMKPDKYGRTTIRNIYYDTDSYLLIRRSIEKPLYKEKLRLRSYGKTEADSTVFIAFFCFMLLIFFFVKYTAGAVCEIIPLQEL